MVKNKHLERISAAFYCVLLAGFILFGIYMFFFEHNEVYCARQFGSFDILQPEGEHIISDEAAPAGIRREFTFTIPELNNTENCLAFYQVHHYVQVFFDDELVYNLSPGANNRIGHSPSSNWVMIPILPTDTGRSVTILLTPVFESVANRTFEFSLGSLADILTTILKENLPQLILSVLCIISGFLLFGTQILMLLHKKVTDMNLLYLGIFTVFIGIWRITDTRFSSILFSNNSMALGYFTIGALFLMITPLLLHMKSYYPSSEKLILGVSLAASAAAAMVLLCQVFGVAEFRQMLFVSHISIIVCIATFLFSVVRRSVAGTGQIGTRKLLLVLAASSLLDLLHYYIQKSSSGTLLTVFVLVVFCVYQLISSVLQINRRAYTDARTGLFNKNRWDELMKGPYKKTDSIGIFMMDLNRLKYVNDTAGHEAGDKMILGFANILRNTIPPTNTICRWGGDEFTVLVTNASREKMEQYAAAITSAVEYYNASGETPQIHFAFGWALSSEFPGRSPTELLEEADQRMYLNKQQWYSVNVRTM